jgi:hypothetical protein
VRLVRGLARVASPVTAVLRGQLATFLVETTSRQLVEVLATNGQPKELPPDCLACTDEPKAAASSTGTCRGRGHASMWSWRRSQLAGQEDRSITGPRRRRLGAMRWSQMCSPRR